MDHKGKGYFLAILAACLWGIMGIFVRCLAEIGFSSFDTAFIRCISAGIVFFCIKGIHNPRILRIDAKGLVICGLYGALAYSVSFVTYGIAVERIPVAVATVLMFMSPIWVALLSVFVFWEKLRKEKIYTILICIIGAAMVSNLVGASTTRLDAFGVFAGALNGFGVALQIMIPRYFQDQYERDTMLVYGFLGAALALGFLADFSLIVNALQSGTVMKNVMNMLGIGVLCTMVANVSFVKATLYIDATTTSILSALEVVVGAVVGFMLFQEHLSWVQTAGAVIVMLGALGPTLLQMRNHRG